MVGPRSHKAAVPRAAGSKSCDYARAKRDALVKAVSLGRTNQKTLQQSCHWMNNARLLKCPDKFNVDLNGVACQLLGGKLEGRVERIDKGGRVPRKQKTQRQLSSQIYWTKRFIRTFCPAGPSEYSAYGKRPTKAPVV